MQKNYYDPRRVYAKNRYLDEWGFKNPVISYIKTNKGEKNMAKLKDEAQAYEPTLTKNIADLDKVSLEIDVQEKTATDKEGKEFTYKYAVIDGEEYRIPRSVLKEIKTIMEEMPEVTHVKVKKLGEGLQTEYKTLPILQKQ